MFASTITLSVLDDHRAFCGRRHGDIPMSLLHTLSCRRCFNASFLQLEPFPLALAHGVGSNSLFSRASSPVRVFRRERDLLWPLVHLDDNVVHRAPGACLATPARLYLR